MKDLEAKLEIAVKAMESATDDFYRAIGKGYDPKNEKQVEMVRDAEIIMDRAREALAAIRGKP